MGVSFQKHRYGEEVIHEGYQDKRVQEDAEAERPHGQNAKEKSHSVPEAGAPENGQETPVEYASRKVISAEERTADAVVRGTSSAGRILAEKSYEKIKERRRGQPMATHVEENTEEYASNLSNGSGKEPHKAAIKNPAKERVKERTISEDTEPFRMMESGKNSPGVEAAKNQAGQEGSVPFRFRKGRENSFQPYRNSRFF